MYELPCRLTLESRPLLVGEGKARQPPLALKGHGTDTVVAAIIGCRESVRSYPRSMRSARNFETLQAMHDGLVDGPVRAIVDEDQDSSSSTYTARTDRHRAGIDRKTGAKRAQRYAMRRPGLPSLHAGGRPGSTPTQSGSPSASRLASRQRSRFEIVAASRLRLDSRPRSSIAGKNLHVWKMRQQFDVGRYDLKLDDPQPGR